MEIDLNLSDVYKIQKYTNTKQFMLESELKRLQSELIKLKLRRVQLQERALKFSRHAKEFKKNIYLRMRDSGVEGFKEIRKLVDKSSQRREDLVQSNKENLSQLGDKISRNEQRIEQLQEGLQLVKKKKIKYDELLVLIRENM